MFFFYIYFFIIPELIMFHFQVVDTCTHNNFRPMGCAMDFEIALSNAVTTVFGESVGIMRDFFHLKVCLTLSFFVSFFFNFLLFFCKQQAIVRKIESSGLKDFQSVILNDVDVLWYAESALEFNTLSTKILMDWRTSFPDFAEYFEKQWMRKHKPSEWASFGRPRDAPSGIASAFIYCIVVLTFTQKEADQWKD